MTVKRIGFVGLKTAKYAETLDLFRDCLGVLVTSETSDQVSLTLEDGTLLELYRPENDFHAFFKTGPVVAFEVDDFSKTRAAMIAKEIEFIGEIQQADGVSWQHFHLPDGTVAEIIGPG